MGLAEMIIRMTGSKSKIVFGLLPEDDQGQRLPDIALARQGLGWKPLSTPLDDGLARDDRLLSTSAHLGCAPWPMTYS